MRAVEISDLSYTYPDGTVAIDNLNLQIDGGKKVALLGANGSGKTTLLYHLNGLLLPQRGWINILENPLTNESVKTIRKHVGLLFDNPDNQLFSTTVYNDIAFGPRNMDLSEDEVAKRVEQTMELVNIIHLKDKPPFNLSLGQKKKVAIAGILAMEPKILLFDEPYSGLDPYSSQQVTDLLATLHSRGSTIVISTHDVNMAYRWADEVIVLHGGKILAQGSVSLLADIELMGQALLEVPMLARIFDDSVYKPKTVEEAKQLLAALIVGQKKV